jgi:hypothetical protein
MCPRGVGGHRQPSCTLCAAALCRDGLILLLQEPHTASLAPAREHHLKVAPFTYARRRCPRQQLPLSLPPGAQHRQPRSRQWAVQSAQQQDACYCRSLEGSFFRFRAAAQPEEPHRSFMPGVLPQTYRGLCSCGGSTEWYRTLMLQAQHWDGSVPIIYCVTSGPLQ